MSLDLWMSCDHCGQSVGDFNYTWNCSPMWYAVREQDRAMIPIEGMTGEESIAILQDGLDKLKATPEKFIAMNPANGWGSYDSFVEWIENLLKHAKEYPRLKWSASR